MMAMPIRCASRGPAARFSWYTVMAIRGHRGLTLKVLLADDHAILRDGLRAILEAEGFVVTGEAVTGREAIALALSTRPDVVVMDVSMPELNGIDAARHIVAELPATKVVGLSMHSDRRYVMAMFSAGASGYLLKDSASEELIAAIRAVARGQKYVSPAIAALVLGANVDASSPRAASKPLTTREREVLQLIAEGSSSKEVAARLDISVPTVETHRRKIMAKLELRSIAELTKFAIREGLTSVER